MDELEATHTMVDINEFAVLNAKIKALEHFASLFKSYNPIEPMAPGMRAEFFDRRNNIERFM